MEYQYEVTSLVGYLQRVATHLLTKGYYFFVQGLVPADKDPTALDAKLLAKYDVVKTEGARRASHKPRIGKCSVCSFPEGLDSLGDPRRSSNTRGRENQLEGRSANAYQDR